MKIVRNRMNVVNLIANKGNIALINTLSLSFVALWQIYNIEWEFLSYKITGLREGTYSC